MKVDGSLVFFIGNAEVKGAIVTNEHKKLPRIITSRTRDLPFYTDRTREHLESRILNEFSELVREMKTKDTLVAAPKVKIRNALVVLSSPWYVSETSVIKMKEAKPFIVTEKLLDTSKENISKAYRDAHKIDISILEQRILQISLNGYQTTNPLKKKASEMDMSIFTSFARKSSVEKIQDLIEQNFHVQKVEAHSHSLAAFTILQSVWKDTKHYILADVTSELTELVVIKNGVPAEAASFPKGKKYLRDIISAQLGVSMEVAASFLNNYEKGTLDPDFSDKIVSALEVAKRGWTSDFSEALSQLSSGASLPKQFFLFASKDSGRTFSEFISTESYQQFSFAEGVFEVKVVSALDFKDKYTFESGVIPDPSLVVGILFNYIQNQK